MLDRVVARIGTSLITMTDVNAAMVLGLVDAPGFDEAAEAMILRHLMLAEVARFAPPDPAADAIDREAARMKQQAGTRLPQVVASTGLTEEGIRESARDTLRIQAYVNQRFGPEAQRRPGEVEQWMKDLGARATVTRPSPR